VPLDGGRFATSDLNDLYRRVINRNNRLKKLMELKAPDVIIRNEKRMLQEAVDALFDNGRRGRVLRGAQQPAAQVAVRHAEGQAGPLPQNLLGKRVDYSGRSVIVVGPELKLHQCGLPKKMALELFKPFIYNKLEERQLVATIKQAKEMVEQQRPEVWDILEEVIREHPVLLNRAPTLHRLGIQAFEPVLVEGQGDPDPPARLHGVQRRLRRRPDGGPHPAVARGADRSVGADDVVEQHPQPGQRRADRGAVAGHRPRLLLPDQGEGGRKGEGRAFGNVDDVVLGLEAGELETLTPIRLRFTGTLLDLTTARDDQDVLHTDTQEVQNRIINTTVGRVLLNDLLPKGMPFVNGLLKKKGLPAAGAEDVSRLRSRADRRDARRAEAARLHLRDAFRPVDRIDDLVIPAVKHKLVDDARTEVIKVEQQYLEGAITNGERYNKIIAVWSEVTEKIADEMFSEMAENDRTGRYFNPVYIMADSGARGSKQQIRQLAGMRGLMAKPSGEIIEAPITSNFREGLTVQQYFISTHGARKGLADTALKTADSAT
jgi:DNA-directed RNA polymerase subunit beta'